MEAFLETERLRLRRFTLADARLLVALDSDPQVMRYISAGAPTTPDEVEHEVLPAFLGHYRRYAGYGFFAAQVRAAEEFLGWFHLRPAPGDPVDQPELGYRLIRSAWGQGYATEGSRALVRNAFTALEAQRVVASTMAVNTASRRVMEKSGLRFVRHFKADWPVTIPGDEFGDVEYALTREEWEGGAARR